MQRRQHPGNAAGKRCVELGCRSIIIKKSLFRAGAARILLTDGNSDAVENCKHNMSLNNCKTSNDAQVRVAII